MSDIYLTGAQVVFPDAVERADLLISQGHIRAISPVSSGRAQRFDYPQAVLLPGVVDMHCDSIERELSPRPRVHFPAMFALHQCERRMLHAGVTTAYHAVTFNDSKSPLRDGDFSGHLCAGISEFSRSALVDHRVHCRYEVRCARAAETVMELLEEGRCHLLSLMDHSPGKGQYRNEDDFRHYLSYHHHLSAAEIDQIMKEKKNKVDPGQVHAVLAAAQQAKLPVACHDPEEVGEVEEMAVFEANIAEFPINVAAARCARERDMHIVMGAPNLLRDASQSGSLRARELLGLGLLDGLCSDYAPATMLAAVFKVADLGLQPLAEAVKMVSQHPAEMAGLRDRGRIAVGQRADLVVAYAGAGEVQVNDVWIGGERVLHCPVRKERAYVHA